MKHRHLVYAANTAAERLPSAAIVDLLERGDFEAWRPIAAAIRARPHGALAERVLSLLDAYPVYGTSPLWRAWIDRCRVRVEAESHRPAPVGLATLRRRKGMTQAFVAARAGMSQSDLSKLERRSDVRLSTLHVYAKALGGRLEAVFMTGEERQELHVGAGAARSAARPRRPSAKRARG